MSMRPGAGSMEIIETTLPPKQEITYGSPPGYVGRPIVFFDMHDPRWDKAEYPYEGDAQPPGELGITGCVPGTLAEVASTFHGTPIYPDQVSGLLQSAHSPEGTNVDKALGIFCRFYEFKLVDRIPAFSNPDDTEKLRDHLAHECIVIASFNENSPFTNTAHVLIIRAISQDLQKFMVVDNNDTTEHQEGKLPNRNQTEFDTKNLPFWLRNGCWVVSDQPTSG